MKLLLLFLVTVLAPDQILGLMHRCPHIKHFSNTRLKQNITYFNTCFCEKSKSVGVLITCKRMNSKEMLSTALNFLRDYIIDRITIKNSGPLYLTQSVFRGLHIQKLTFEDVHFNVLDLFAAIKGLEFELEELELLKCRVNNWAWEKGSHFVHLETLIFDKTNLPLEITDQIFKYFPRKLRNLKITDCNVRVLGDKAMKNFFYLERVELGENHLTKISRSMFPKPARRLKHLALTGNPITELPNDLFQNMERLEFLLLSDIRVSSLSNETFSPVWKQLEEIYLNNIVLKCDCNIVWMIKEDSEASMLRKPFCSSHRRGLEKIKDPDLICPRNIR